MTLEARTIKRYGKPKTKYYYIYSKPAAKDYENREPVATFTSIETAALVKRYLEGCDLTAEEQLEARDALKEIDKGE